MSSVLTEVLQCVELCNALKLCNYVIMFDFYLTLPQTTIMHNATKKVKQTEAAKNCTKKPCIGLISRSLLLDSEIQNTFMSLKTV